MKNILILSIITFGLFGCDQEEINPRNLTEEINMIAKPYILSGERVGIAIGTYDNGITQFYSYGVKSLKDGGEIDENTMFEIGSITKTFTATLLAKLHLKGDVDMEDPLQQYFDGTIIVPKYNDQEIRLKQLANHTSSLPRLPSNIGDNEATLFEEYDIEDFYSFINSYTLTRPIGSKSEYSNIGMGILGYVLKEQQNKTYFDLVRDEILIPLGMDETVLNFEEVNHTNVATGHVGSKQKTQMKFSEVFEGAGVLNSNISDMMSYLEAQLTTHAGGELSTAMQMTHTKTNTYHTPEGSDIGLAWIVTKLEDGQEIHWHNGGTLSYNSFMGFNKSTGTGVVILMNSRNMHYSGEVNFGFELMTALNKY